MKARAARRILWLSVNGIGADWCGCQPPWLAEAVKDPEHFDCENYLAQIVKAEFYFDQMDAFLATGDDRPDSPPNAPRRED